MHRRVTRLLLPALAAAAVLPLHGGADPASAGCLAPTDAVVDSSNVGPMWGNSVGDFIYTRNPTGTRRALVRRSLGGASEELYGEGDRNGFFVGSEEESWVAFLDGTINADGDIAFVATTTIDDDPNTIPNESLARSGVYARTGNTTRRIMRFGEDSHVTDPFSNPVPWASAFQSVAEGSGGGPLSVLFRAQLGGTDRRVGIFRWSQSSGLIENVVLEGDPSPAGGVFATLARLRANEQGDVAFLGLTQVGEGPLTAGLFLALAGSGPGRIVKLGTDGDAAPGGGLFSILNDFSLDDDATLYFSATLAGTGRDSGLFRAEGDFYTPELLLRQGDATPLGGTYDTLTNAVVRATQSGELVFGATLSDDIESEGIFTIAPGETAPLPLADPDDFQAVAALGSGRAAYQDDFETRVVVPADGTEEGPTDFRISLLDVKNKARLKTDTIRLKGAFRLPAVSDAPGAAPPLFVTAGQERSTPTKSFASADLLRVVEVKISISDLPGNNFVFGMQGSETSPAGTLLYNGSPVVEKPPKLRIGKSGDKAKWKYSIPNIGRGQLVIDLTKQTFDFKLSQGSIQPSFEPGGFLVSFTLRTAADVTGNRDGDQAFVHHSMRITADGSTLGSTGVRVRSNGSGVAGGTVFVDALQVKRKLKVTKGQAAPAVTSDTVQLVGTLRICPGSTPPGTPTLTADLSVGDFVLDDVVLERRGKKGSKYRFKGGGRGAPKITLDVDVTKAVFKLKASGIPPLTQLVDADFSGGGGPNDSRTAVAGMVLPFSIAIDRVYEASFDVPVVRQRGGKVFRR